MTLPREVVALLALATALPFAVARADDELPIEAFLLPEDLDLELPLAPIARPSDGSLTIAVGPILTRGLDEARDALVQARVDQMASALGGARVVRLKTTGEVTQQSVCKAAAFVDADFVLTGRIELDGDRGRVALTAADVATCHAQSLERAILRRQESTLVATVDVALCRLVRKDERPKACTGAVRIAGDAAGLEARVGGLKRTLHVAGESLESFVGTYPLVVCRGADCSQPALVDVQLGDTAEVTVSLACGRPQLLAPGAVAQCDTVVVETLVDRPFPWAPVGSAALGVALVATGIVFGLQANGARDDLHAAYDTATLTQDEASRLSSAMQASATRANVAYGLGALAMGAGATLFFLDF